MSPFFLFVYLILGGTLGGLLSTIASMASLATYPILLSVGIPPVYANTTNDAALIWTGVGSTASSLKELKGALERSKFLFNLYNCWISFRMYAFNTISRENI